MSHRHMAKRLCALSCDLTAAYVVKVSLLISFKCDEGQGPKTSHNVALIWIPDQISPGGYFRCADFVLFFSMGNINNWCWLSTGTEINRWLCKIWTGLRVTWTQGKNNRNDTRRRRLRWTQMFCGSPLCDRLYPAGGLPQAGYSRHLSSLSAGPRQCWWLPTVGSLTMSVLICSFPTTQNPAGETI